MFALYLIFYIFENQNMRRGNWGKVLRSNWTIFDWANKFRLSQTLDTSTDQKKWNGSEVGITNGLEQVVKPTSSLNEE